jgi:glucoamylase
VSQNVILSHEDKYYSGAFIASASIPWGQHKGDDDVGGYHLVWTRDMVQSATALLACGRVDTARRALVYLACTQKPDGSFAQNFWINGTPYWSGHSTRRGRLSHHPGVAALEAGRLGDFDVFPFRGARRRIPGAHVPRSPSRSAGKRLPVTPPLPWRR